MASITGRIEGVRVSARGERRTAVRRHLCVVRDLPPGESRPGVRSRPAERPVARSAGEAGRPLRLTNRGRVVLRSVLTLGLVLAMAVAVLLLDRPARAGVDAQRVAVATHVVQPGETLWDIAGRVAPDVDRRDTVVRIVELNGLGSSAVDAGQEIVLPPGE